MKKVFLRGMINLCCMLTIKMKTENFITGDFNMYLQSRKEGENKSLIQEAIGEEKLKTTSNDNYL